MLKILKYKHYVFVLYHDLWKIGILDKILIVGSVRVIHLKLPIIMVNVK